LHACFGKHAFFNVSRAWQKPYGGAQSAAAEKYFKKPHVYIIYLKKLPAEKSENYEKDALKIDAAAEKYDIIT